MKDLVKKGFLVGLGITEIGKQKLEQEVKKYLDKNNITREESKKAAEVFVKDLDKYKNKATKVIKKELARAEKELKKTALNLKKESKKPSKNSSSKPKKKTTWESLNSKKKSVKKARSHKIRKS